LLVNEAAAALHNRVHDVARRAVQLMLEAAPTYAATLDERGRLLCEEDAELHVRALVGSVVAGDPRIFGDYAVWAAELVGRFGVAAEQLAALFSATGRAVLELAPSAAIAIEPHLEAGERALAR
jgi:cytosine/adenosine deaminase-related metal-dependent hydrolase